MGQIIFIITLLCVLAYYPEIFLLAGLILAGFYLHKKYELTERAKTVANDEEDFIDPMAKAEKEVESKMKEGYQDDPEWQATSKKINDRGDIMRKISDLEMVIEDLEAEMKDNGNAYTESELVAAQKHLKTLENRAGITQKRAERAKEEKIDPPKTQADPVDMTDQEIDRALQELNDL